MSDTPDPNQLTFAEMVGEAPIRPYAGTIGHAGGATSEARAEREPAGERQKQIVELLEDEGLEGYTVAEIRETTGIHHGTASGALSALHRGAVISRLEHVRNGCSVYVLPEYVNGRATLEPTRVSGKIADCQVRRRGFTDVVEYDGIEYVGAADLVRAMRGES